MPPSIEFGALMPHPPLLIPSIGKEELSHVHYTQVAMQQTCADIVKASPDVVIIVSPHGPMFEDAIVIMDGDDLRGDLKPFGVDESYQAQNDRPLASSIAEQGKQEGVPLILLEDHLKRKFQIHHELDYGTIVPLHYLQQAGYAGKIVLLAPGFLPLERVYQAGMCVRKAIELLGRKVVIIASGDNSHALVEQSPAGATEEGKRFDAALQKALSLEDWMSLFTLAPDFLERAAEDTLGSLFLLIGAFDTDELKGSVLSYEAPFGVGYTVATLKPQHGSAPSLLPSMIASREETIARLRARESEHVRLARMAVETYVREERLIQLASVPTEFEQQAGCFVSIKQNGKLRGCIGTIRPTADHLADEIVRNAIAACSEDDRFFPVEEDELSQLTYSVDVLEPEEEVKDISELDPSVYGVIVSDGQRSGLLLPNLEGIHTVEEQLYYAKEKAGIHPEQEHVRMFRFRVQRYV
ncbi:AmmeMemoRadiSam system protein A [Brevibacillus fluminis]|nr:AmmeMemoRadiSam system protein A [Brevibacillus fluminis]